MKKCYKKSLNNVLKDFNILQFTVSHIEMQRKDKSYCCVSVSSLLQRFVIPPCKPTNLLVFHLIMASSLKEKILKTGSYVLSKAIMRTIIYIYLSTSFIGLQTCQLHIIFLLYQKQLKTQTFVLLL